jgi:hypothetical protein
MEQLSPVLLLTNEPSTSSSGPSSAPSRTIPASTRAISAEAAGKAKKKDNAAQKESGWWASPEIIAFVDWLTDPVNYMNLSSPRTVSGKKSKDIYQIIAEYVNTETGSKWTIATVKQRYQYLRQKYDGARALSKATDEGNTDTENSEDRIRDLCPCFDRLDAVFRSSLSRNPPPPFQSSKVQSGIPSNESDGPSDIEPERDESDATSEIRIDGM